MFTKVRMWCLAIFFFFVIRVREHLLTPLSAFAHSNLRQAAINPPPQTLTIRHMADTTPPPGSTNGRDGVSAQYWKPRTGGEWEESILIARNIDRVCRERFQEHVGPIAASVPRIPPPDPETFLQEYVLKVSAGVCKFYHKRLLPTSTRLTNAQSHTRAHCLLCRRTARASSRARSTTGRR